MSGLLPLTSREIKKWYRNPTFFIVGLLQPFFWIALFGSAFDITRGFGAAGRLILQGAPNYITFIIGGVATTTALFTGMFSGMNIIWDRRLGTLGRFLSSPIHRSSIVFSKIISATIRILVQILILFIAALLIPNGLEIASSFSAFDVILIIVTVTLVSTLFSSIFSVIAIRVTRQETIMGIVNLVNLPLMFASFALFPKQLMAPWLADIAQYNPVSWSATIMRTVIINGSLNASQLSTVLNNFIALFIVTVVVIVITYVLSESEIRQ
ncbi:MAG: ABC transporter permease [Thermoplasmata archaeon]